MTQKEILLKGIFGVSDCNHTAGMRFPCSVSLYNRVALVKNRTYTHRFYFDNTNQCSGEKAGSATIYGIILRV